MVLMGWCRGYCCFVVDAVDVDIICYLLRFTGESFTPRHTVQTQVPQHVLLLLPIIETLSPWLHETEKSL